MSAWDFKDFDDNLKKIADELPHTFEGMAVACASAVKGSHRKRLDNEDPPIKYKSQAYINMRNRKYSQTNTNINMQLSGELVRSMKLGVDGDDILYGIVNTSYNGTSTSKVYGYQKELHPQLIGVNSSDAAKGIESANRYFTEQIQDVFADIQ